MKMGAVVVALVALVLITGLSVSGGFRADIATKRGLLGPVRLGVDGGLGQASAVPDKALQASMPALPQLMLAPPSAPFDGPTQEERVLLQELQDAIDGYHRRLVANLGPEERQMVPSFPDVPMPMRHLTPYEMKAIRADIARFNGSQ